MEATGENAYPTHRTPSTFRAPPTVPPYSTHRTACTAPMYLVPCPLYPPYGTLKTSTAPLHAEPPNDLLFTALETRETKIKISRYWATLCIPPRHPKKKIITFFHFCQQNQRFRLPGRFKKNIQAKFQIMFVPTLPLNKSLSALLLLFQLWIVATIFEPQNAITTWHPSALGSPNVLTWQSSIYNDCKQFGIAQSSFRATGMIRNPYFFFITASNTSLSVCDLPTDEDKNKNCLDFGQQNWTVPELPAHTRTKWGTALIFFFWNGSDNFALNFLGVGKTMTRTLAWNNHYLTFDTHFRPMPGV